MDSETVTYDSPTLRSFDATLSRVQRALAFKQRQQNPEIAHGFAQGCQIERPFDPRKSSLFTFERNVIFLSMNVVKQKDESGAVTGLHICASRLDTKKLERMAPGRNGSSFIEEIESMVMNFSDTQWRDGVLAGRVRKHVAQLFENVVSIKNHAREASIGGPGRNIVLVGYNTPALLAGLHEIGFDPKMHTGVLDIVDIAELAMAYHQRRSRHDKVDKGTVLEHTARDVHLAVPFQDILDELEISFKQPKYYGHQLTASYDAHATLTALIKYTLKDIEKHAGRISLLGANGGDFPGPYRKLVTEGDKLAYRVERLLSIRRDATAEVVCHNTQKLIASHISTAAFRPEPAKGEHQQEPDLEGLVRQLNITGPLAKVTKYQGTEVHIIGPPRREYTSETATSTAANKDVSPNTRTSSSATQAAAKAERRAFFRTFEANFQTNVLSQSSRPQGIRNVEIDYHRADDEFTDILKQAAKLYCSIEAFGKILTRETYYEDISRWKIFPDENYAVLAQIVVDNEPEKVTSEMMTQLKREMVGRRLVNRWYTDQTDVGQEKGDLDGSHRKFLETLQETMSILLPVFVKNCEHAQAILAAESFRVKKMALGVRDWFW